MLLFKRKILILFTFLLVSLNNYGTYQPDYGVENSSEHEHLLENPFDEPRGREIRREDPPQTPRYIYAAPPREQTPTPRYAYDTHRREWVTIRQQPPPPPREQVAVRSQDPRRHAYAVPREQVTPKPQQVSTVYGAPSVEPVSVSHVSRRAPVYDMASNVGKKSFYAGFGVAADVINPHGNTEIVTAINFPELPNRLRSEFNSGSSLQLSPKIFIGVEQENIFKGVGLRLQIGADFHRIHLSKQSIGSDLLDDDEDFDFAGASLTSMDFYFNYTFSVGAQLTKKLSNNLEGYLGLSVLGTWAQITQNYTFGGEDLAFLKVDSGEKSLFMLGVSPQIGFIYRASDRLFYCLDAHLSFYQRALHQGNSILGILRFDTRMIPQWGGISAGIGWKL
ncbi:hypothetical protein OAN21_01170 [Alphaproteobacteria bacterium]|nr:hypothetical protein [Alphaproteobacteria bacterium]